jgi:hypothetical protein
MKKGLAAKKADVPDSSSMQNLERFAQTCSVDATQVLMRDFAIRKVAEVAGCVTGIGDSNIAQCRATVTKETQHVQNLRAGRRHSRR